MNLWPVSRVQTSGLNPGVDLQSWPSRLQTWLSLLNVASVTNEDHGDRKLLVTVKSQGWAVGNEFGSRNRHYRMHVHLVCHLLPRAEHPDACLQDFRTSPQEFCRAVPMMDL